MATHDPLAVLNATLGNGQTAPAEGAPPPTVAAAVPGQQPAASPETPVQLPSPEEMLALAQGQEPPPPAAKSPFLQKLVAEVGDEEVLVQRLLGQANGIASLHQELAALRELVGSRVAPQPTFDAASDPAVQHYSEQIAAIDSEIKANNDEQLRLAQEGHAVNAQLQRLYGKLELAEDYAKPQLQQEIAALKQEHAAKNLEYSQFKRSNTALYRDRTNLEFQQKQAIAGAQRAHQESLLQSKEQAVQDAAAAQQTRQEFDGALQKHAARYGIGNLATLRTVLVDRFQNYVATLPEGSPAVDLDAFVAQGVDTLAKSFGLSPKAEFTQQSRERALASISASQRLPTQPSPQAALPQGFDQLSNEQKVQAARDHARRVLAPGMLQRP